MEDLLREFIEANIDLIDDEEWDKLFKICPRTIKNDIINMLKETGFDLPKSKTSSQNIRSHAEIVKLIKKFLSEHGIDYLFAHNDKGKTGRKLKFVGVRNCPDNIDRLLADYLDSLDINYEYIDYNKHDLYSMHPTRTLTIRLTSEVIR